MQLPPNMGTIDRMIRFAAAIAVAIAYALGWISGPVAIIPGILAIAFVVTSLVGFCPIYWLYRPRHSFMRKELGAG